MERGRARALIQPNLSILAEVDPDNTVVESNEGDNKFPASGTPLALDVRTSPTFSVRFVPVDGGGTTRKRQQRQRGAVPHRDDQDASPRRRSTRTCAPRPSCRPRGPWMPAAPPTGPRYSARSTPPAPRRQLAVLLRRGQPELQQRHRGDRLRGRAGGARLGQTAERRSVAAHEWGHNWGRQSRALRQRQQSRHEFPLRGRRHGRLRTRCGRRHAQAARRFTISWATAIPSGSATTRIPACSTTGRPNPDVSTALTQAMQPCLLVWGRIENGQPVLEPAFEIVTRPSLPASGGEYSVEGRAADGSRIFSLPFTPAEIADVSTDSRQFSFAIPLSAARAARLASLRLAGRAGEVDLHAAPRSSRRPAPASRRVAAGAHRHGPRIAPVGCRGASDAAGPRRRPPDRSCPLPGAASVELPGRHVAVVGRPSRTACGAAR